MSDDEYDDDDDELFIIRNPEMDVNVPNIEKIEEMITAYTDSKKEPVALKLPVEPLINVMIPGTLPSIILKITSILDKHFKTEMGILKKQKISSQKANILFHRKKNFLFNCIRSAYKLPTMSYEDEIANILGFENPTEIKKFIDSRRQCKNCGSNNTREESENIICMDCGNVSLNTSKEFIGFNQSSSTGAKDMTQLFLGFKMFDKGPLGFEGTKYRLERKVKNYYDEILSSVLNETQLNDCIRNFRMKATPKKSQAELKMIIVEYIVEHNTKYFYDYTNIKNIIEYFKLSPETYNVLKTYIDSKKIEDDIEGYELLTTDKKIKFNKYKNAVIEYYKVNKNSEWMINNNNINDVQTYALLEYLFKDDKNVMNVIKNKKVPQKSKALGILMKDKQLQKRFKEL